MIETLVQELRDAGMVLWVENDCIRGKMRNGGKIPYETRLKAEQLRDMGLIAVDYLRKEPKPYVLTGLSPDEALSLGEAFKRGEILLVGKVVYHQSTGLFDITFIPLGGGEHCERQEEREPGRT